MKLPVYCCCEPDRRLGWIDVPGLTATPCLINFAIRSAEPAPMLRTRIEWHWSYPYGLEVYQCSAGRPHTTIPVLLRRLAVSSGDYPLDVWRRVPGFVEDLAAR